jgi:nitroreductase
LLVDCQILFKVDPARDSGLRPAEGDDDLVLWDFHDLLFHARSTEGRHANPMGGVYPYADVMPAPPAVRPRWPGKKIDLRKVAAAPAPLVLPVAKLLRERHSTRSFDDRRPITLAELARFLDGAARVQSKWSSPLDLGDGAPMVGYAARPYPSGGGSWELELYLAVDNCEGLARGFYHYDADGHALVPIGVRTHELDALLAGAGFAMGEARRAPDPDHDRGALRPDGMEVQLARLCAHSERRRRLDANALSDGDRYGLGGCAIGTVNIDLFAKMTGIEFHVEGPVGQFAMGRGMKSEASG